MDVPRNYRDATKTIEFENRTMRPIEHRALLNVVMDITCWISFVFLINDAKIKTGEGKRRNEFAEWHVA